MDTMLHVATDMMVLQWLMKFVHDRNLTNAGVMR